MCNAMTPGAEWVTAGVRAVMGVNNVADAMVPWSGGDMWNELTLMATVCRYDSFEDLVEIATRNGRMALGLEPYEPLPIKK